MKKSVKVLLITAASLVVIGLAVLAIAMASVGWDIGKLGKADYETNTYEITESFDNLSVKALTEDVALVLSDDKTCKVVCYEREETKHDIGVKDKTLEIGASENREWFENISLFSFEAPKITVYLPKNSLGSLSIETGTGEADIPAELSFDSIRISGSTGKVSCSASTPGVTEIGLDTGDIQLSGISAGELKLSTTTGDIKVESAEVKGKITVGVSTGRTNLSGVKCSALSSEGSTGDIVLQNVIASQDFLIKRSTGDVKLDGSDASELLIGTSTGDVTGTLLSDKVFITDSNTGDISVPKTTSGGKCEITTTTGDIILSINKTL